MMRKIFNAVCMLVVALVLALVSVWWLVLHPPAALAVPVVVSGPWRANPVAGSVDADMYTRAFIAINGLFALERSEAIYFAATRDDNGDPLRARCDYVIEGRPVDARWWSITAYADDNFLIPNDAQRFSYNMGGVKGGPDGSFRILAAATEQSGDWLPTGGGDGGFNLVFRLYHPGPGILANPGAISLPSIRPTGRCP